MIYPKSILDLMKYIEKSGYKIYLVGGCVRDTLLGRTPVDYDLATNASSSELVELLSQKHRVFQVGQHFSTLIVKLVDFDVEVSTFRRRAGNEIVHDGTLETDLRCRDFTINAMAMDARGELIDLQNGLVDLKNRRLRSIEAEALLNEDPLRALRAIRFMTNYRLMMDSELTKAIHKIALQRPRVSPERKREELFKMLVGEQPVLAIRSLIEFGLIDWYTFGPLISRMKGYDQENPYHDKTLLEHTLTVLENTPKDIDLRLAALLHDVGKPDVQTIDEVAHYYQHEKVSAEHAKNALRSLKCSNQRIDDVTRLISAHMFSPTDIGEKGLKRLLRKVGGFDQLYKLMDLMKADILGTAYPERAVCMKDLKLMVKVLEENETAFRKKDLNISGRDLMDIGIPQGRELGRWMNTLLEEVIDGKLENERSVLMDYVQQQLMNK